MIKIIRSFTFVKRVSLVTQPNFPVEVFGYEEHQEWQCPVFRHTRRRFGYKEISGLLSGESLTPPTVLSSSSPPPSLKGVSSSLETLPGSHKKIRKILSLIVLLLLTFLWRVSRWGHFRYPMDRDGPETCRGKGEVDFRLEPEKRTE